MTLLKPGRLTATMSHSDSERMWDMPHRHRPARSLASLTPRTWGLPPVQQNPPV